MKTIKNILGAIFLGLLLIGITNVSVAADTQSSQQPINNTITHLEAAIKALDANDPETAQMQMKAGRQSAKNIIGGSLEVKTQRGSNAINNARRLAQKGDTAGASATLQEAIAVFKSLNSSSETGSRGGLK